MSVVPADPPPWRSAGFVGGVMSVSRWGGVCLAAAVFVSGPAWAQQGTSWFPAAGTSATLIYEDLWPAKGDYDFNDAALRVSVRTDEDGVGVTSMTYDFTVFALGASRRSGLGIRIAGVDPGQVTAQRKEGTAGSPTGAPWTTTVIAAVSDGDGGSVIPVSPDLRSDLCGGQPGFLNTVQGEPTRTCAPVAINLTFATPWTSAPQAPGDVFLYRSDRVGQQIHRQPFAGVPGGSLAVDPSLYLTMDDASEVDPSTKAPVGDDFYVTTSRIPFGLLLPDAQYAIPQEGRPIDIVMPAIVQFALGEPSGNTFWHGPFAEAFDFDGGLLPPVPYAVWDGSPEESLCEADPIGVWTGAGCTCTSGGPLYTWNGATCEITEESRCEADPHGATWSAGDCDCGTPWQWSGTECFDATSPQEAACDAGGGTWTGADCSCLANYGVLYAWTGEACEITEAALCDADYYGTWVGGACDCGTLAWNGASCFDATDSQIDACVNGSWTYGGYYGTNTFIGGGGEWVNGTCDCTTAGVGYYWNGYGCHDPSAGQEALCEADGATWAPWESYAWWGWNPFQNTDSCDCAVYGPGFRWNGAECADASAGTADDCEADGGRWNASVTSCDCRDLGYGWQWDGTSCAPSVAEQSCVTEGGTWTGSFCDCPNGQVWSGDPNNLPMGGSCLGGAEEACAMNAGTWADGTCDCASSGFSNPTWDPERWQCRDAVEGEANCAMAGGTWTGDTCDCAAFGFGYTWDGFQMCINTPEVSSCETEGGTWAPWTPFTPMWTGPTSMYGGTCDCPAGEIWTWNGMYGSCTPYAETECWYAGMGMWNMTTCDCGWNNNPSRPHAVWDGETCAPSIEREVCEMAEGSTWDSWSNTCMCSGTPGCPGCGGTPYMGIWDPIDLQCESPERDCYREGGTWNTMSMTCDCSMSGSGSHSDWDGQHCVYSGERHACEAAGSMWMPPGVGVYNPQTGMTDYGATCDCYNYEGYTSGGYYYYGYYYGAELLWDDQRLECVDMVGKYTCEREYMGWWDTFTPPGTCSCPQTWDPDTNSYLSARWNNTTFECTPDAEVTACYNAGAMWTSNMGIDGCSCDSWMHGPGAWWSWDGTNGECTSMEKQGCDATGGSWMNPGCDCTSAGPGHWFQQDPMTWEWECANPAEETCESSYPGSTWDPMNWNCDCAGAGPYDAWDGMSCTYTLQKQECMVMSGGTWRTDGPAPGWCEVLP